MKKFYLPLENMILPFSRAVEINGLVFLSGQIHKDSTGHLVGDNMEEKFEVIILNIKRTLAEIGLDLSDVINLKIHMVNLDLFSNLDEVYLKYFKNPFPTFTVVEVTGLPFGASLALDVVAFRDN